MNEPSPLVPQGSFEAQARRKSHVRIAVFSILAIHVIVLGGLLILGCKREEKPVENADTPPPMTNDLTPPPFGADPVVAGATNVPPATNATAVFTPTTPTIPATPITPPVTIPPEVSAAVTDHKIAKGESFSTLATKYGVSLKAIVEANPNLVPTKLQIGDVVKIPAKSAAPAAGGTTTVAPEAADTYTVKSGDVLGTIAQKHGTTVKELQRLNNLTTTQIKVGQKLKLPAKSAPPAGAVPPAQ